MPIDNGWKAALVTWSLPRWSTGCHVCCWQLVGSDFWGSETGIMNKKTKTNSWSSHQPVSRQFPVGCGLYIFPSHGNIRLYPVHHVCDVWRGLGGDLSSEGGLGGEFLRRHLIFNTSCSKWQRGGFVFFTQIQISLNRKIDAKVDKGPLWFATGFKYKSPTVENR